MKLFETLQIVRHFGLANVLRGAWHRLLLKSGWMRTRLPVRQWSDITLERILLPICPREPGAYADKRAAIAGQFFFPWGRPPDYATLEGRMDASQKARTTRIADDFCAGRFLYFSRMVGDLGEEVNWHLNPFTGVQADHEHHWSQVPDFADELGDIKLVWEPSRFAFVYWLVRAWLLTGEGRYVHEFWRLVESWMRANPPQVGVHWQSGQEVALRAMALCFGFYAFAGHPTMTRERIALTARLLHVHAERIAAFTGHAIRQNTNHALTEATGLLTIGLLWPELAGAERWAAVGRWMLEHTLAGQVARDGGYVQQSTNYHRLMLQTCCWAVRLAERNGVRLSTGFSDALGRATAFLLQLVEPATGRTPNYGANDGSLILPLDSCDYLDYRPALQLAAAVTGRGRPFGDGPWDEPVTWLFGDDVPAREAGADMTPTTSSFDQSGYYTLRAHDTWCMVRCHSYTTRVGHVDPLHVDLWYRGENVLRDGGSYHYFLPGEPDVERYFTSIGAHNTVRIDGQDPLDRVGRFMWLPWPRARCLQRARTDGPGRLSWEGEHYAYLRRPGRCVHQRRIEYDVAAGWRIIDRIEGAGRHHVVWCWRLPRGPWSLDAEQRRIVVRLTSASMELAIRCSGRVKLDVHEGVTHPSQDGWESLYYGCREPVPVLTAAIHAKLPVVLETAVTFREHQP